MKHNEVENIKRIRNTDLANIFNVYEDEELGNFQLSYSINRTFNIIGIENVNRKYYNNYVVKEMDTWLSIAYATYGDNRMWWMVCKMNNIHDPTVSPVPGEQLKLLKAGYIDGILNAIEGD